jgi:replication factor A1
MSYSSNETPTLTPDDILTMVYTKKNDDLNQHNIIQPILQILNYVDMIKVETKLKQTKITLSDSKHYISCMYTGTNVITSLDVYSYVRITNFDIRVFRNRVITIIKSMEIIHPKIAEQERVGNPIDIEKTDLLSDLINSHNTSTIQLQQQLQQQQDLTLTQPQSSTTILPHSPLLNNNNSAINNTVTTSSNQNITPIKSLNMYIKKWTIKGRITTKQDKSSWQNIKSEGTLFNIVILDESNENIRATFFNQAVDKFYNIIQLSKIYTFTGGRLKLAKQQYNTCSNTHEITFDENAIITLMHDDGVIPLQRYNFISSISDIQTLEENTVIDVIAIVKSIGQCTPLISKSTGKEIFKCDLTLIDDSYTEINFTLWDKAAQKASTLYLNQPAVAIRRAKVSKYGTNISLKGDNNSGGIDRNTLFIIEATRLLMWWFREKKKPSTTPSHNLSLSNSKLHDRIDEIIDRSDIITIKDHSLGTDNKQSDHYLTIRGYCTLIKIDKEGGAWYEACPNSKDPCKNLYKVTQSADGSLWECQKCGKQYPKPVRRWIFPALIKDNSSKTWVTFFNTEAEILLNGVTADEAFHATYGTDNVFNSDIYESIFQKSLYKEFNLKFKVKSEINPETGLPVIKTQVANIAPVDYQKEALQLLSFLE